MIDEQEIPEAVVTSHERLSVIWLLPLVAVAIAAWLFYKSQVEADIPVLIHFPTGAGLVVGKTEVRYQGIPIGLVDEFQLEDDLDGVLAKVSFDRRAAGALREGTQFWLVRPQVSLKGISGLETLLTGEYIALRLGDGPPKFEFNAYAEPPPLGEKDPGLNITLRAETLGSLQYGAPVHYRQLQVGDVQGYELTEDGKGVLLKLNIQEEYAPLVRANTRFWNNSGIRLKGSLTGLTLQTDSLTSLMIGGVSFDVAAGEPPSAPAQPGTRFQLYDDFEAANTGVLVRVTFETAEGLEAGVTPVLFQGLKVGSVERLEYKHEINKVVAEIKLPPQAEAALNQNTRFWMVKPRFGAAGISGLETLIKGNYIQVEPRPGEGGPVYDFEALPAPPVLGLGDPGLNITLTANTLGSLQQGSPVYYRQLQVGDVQGYELSEDGQEVRIYLNIRDEYAPLVKRNSRFWNNSGLRLKGTLSRLSLQTDSLASLILGGINFDLTTDANAGAQAQSGDRFELYSDAEAADAGVLVRVLFDSAEGLEAEITPVIFRGMKVGTVQRLDFQKDLSQIAAVIKMIPDAKLTLNENTRFWLVKPELSLSGISGLETLVRGNHIAVDPRAGRKPTRQFTALKHPPRLDRSAPGLHLTLFTRAAKGLARGTPVYYRQIQVGSTQAIDLVDDGQQVAVSVHIEPAYARLVNRDSRFWNSSGLSLQAGLGGIKIQSAPLKAMLGGGISFDTPGQATAPLVANGAHFPIYPDRRSALAEGVNIQISFASAEGLAVDAPIRFQGIDIGRVTELQLDSDNNRVSVGAQVAKAYQSLIREDSDFWVVKPKLGLTAAENLDTLLTGGYLRIKPGRGVSGSRFTGLEREPFLVDGGSGYGYILESPRLGSLKKGSPVYFRQVPIGEVAGFRLAEDARHVDIHISIEPRYAPLIRDDTQFWNASGIDVSFKLFGGAKVGTESVESILAGGIALATPDQKPIAPRAQEGQRFSLQDKAKPEWRQWAPVIPLTAR